MTVAGLFVGITLSINSMPMAGNSLVRFGLYQSGI